MVRINDTDVSVRFAVSAAIAFACAVSMLQGCQTYALDVTDRAKTRGQFDLNCQQVDVVVLNQGGANLIGQTAQDRVYGVKGCGKSVTYTEDCTGAFTANQCTLKKEASGQEH